MKLATKTIASLLLVTNAASKEYKMKLQNGKRRRELQFGRNIQRHDRKGEIRAELLGISPVEFRKLNKKQPFEDTVRQHGFKSVMGFRLALLGKLRTELLQRGWTRQKIDRHLMARSRRLN